MLPPRASHVRVVGHQLRLTLSRAALLTGRIASGPRRVGTLDKKLRAGKVAVTLPRLRAGSYTIAFRLTDKAGRHSAVHTVRYVVG